MSVYSVDDLDRVVEVEGIPFPEFGVPLPNIFCQEGHLELAYFVSWGGTVYEPGEWPDSNRKVAVVHFPSHVHIFGDPNDEVLNGHPLYERGLSFSRVYEVIHSSWIRQLEKINSVHPNYVPNVNSKLRHFIFTFKESTFECLAREFTVRILEGKYATPAEALLNLIISEEKQKPRVVNHFPGAIEVKEP